MAENGGAKSGAGSMQLQEPEYTWASMNARQKAKHVLANVTVEPIILIFAVLNTLSGTASFWLNIGRACSRHLNATESACEKLYWGVVDEETEAYVGDAFTIVSEIQVWQTPLRNSVPIILVLFVGSWADKRHRRKPFIIAPIVGDLLTGIGLLVCYFFYSWPLEVPMVIEAVFPALTGALPIIIMSIFSYISDITTTENRTFRIGMVATSFAWGLPIAVAASGPLFEAVGFAPLYILCIVLYVPTLYYAYVHIPEPRPPVPRPDNVSFLVDFFDWKNVWETVKVALKKRKGTRQLQIFLVMALYVAVQGPAHGEAATMSGYQISAFKWGPTDQSFYATYFILVLAMGNIIATTVFSKWLKLHDCVIGMIAMTAKVVVAPLLAWATTGWQFYAVTLLDILISGSAIALRSVASKMVEFDELGKLMALFAVVEAVIPVFFAPIYSKVYSITNQPRNAMAPDTTTAAPILANVTAGLTTLPDVLATAATVLEEGATTLAVDTINATATAIDTAANATAAALGTVANATAAALGTAANATATAIDTAANATATALGTAANATATALGTTANATATALGTAANATAMALGTAANATATAIGTAANATAMAIDAGNSTTTTMAPDASNAAAAHPSAAFLFISCASSLCGLILFAVIYTLQKKQARQEKEDQQDAERDAKKSADFEGGITNAAFQGDHGHLRSRAQNGNGTENTFL